MAYEAARFLKSKNPMAIVEIVDRSTGRVPRTSLWRPNAWSRL